MNILLQKLYDKYIKYTTIGNVIGFANLDNLSSGSLPRLSTFYKKIDLEKEIGYTYEDFLLDYHSKIEKFKEIKTVYNIWCMGLTINEYASMKGLSNQLYKILKKGREIAKPETLIAVIDVIDIDLPPKELNSFQVSSRPSFCRLIGGKKELFKFKEKYDISNPVLPWQDTWQLAFDGVVAEKIKKIY